MGNTRHHNPAKLIEHLLEFWGKSVIDFIAHNPGYQNWICEGVLESFLSQKIEINERLRQLLGEESKETLAHLDAMQKRDKELWSDPGYVQSQTDYYEAHKEEIKANDESMAGALQI